MKPRARVTILGCPIDCISMAETISLIDTAIATGRPLHYTSVDAGKLALMQTDDRLFDDVLASDIIGPDGLSLVWLSRLMKHRLPERITGIDLMAELVKLAAARHYGIFFFGAREHVVQKVVDIYASQHSAGIVAGYRNGYFDPSEEPAIARQIADSGAKILFVAIESPIKERFLYNNRAILDTVPFKMGVGGAFDVVSGHVRRAPAWVQKACLEWIHRFLQEPGKWQTEVVDSLNFLYLILRQTLTGNGIVRRAAKRSS